MPIWPTPFARAPVQKGIDPRGFALVAFGGAGPLHGAIWLTLRSILLDSETYGNVPQNAGLTRPIEIVAPLGTLANPRFPAPVIARFCPGNQLADTVMKALAQAVPEQVSAGIGNLRVVAFSGLEEGRHWVYMEILEGSYGGRHGLDGMDAVDTLYANTRNNPIEDIESHLPLRVDRYQLRDDVAAAGRWRGGDRHRVPLHLSRRWRFLDRGRRASLSALGLQGGNDGTTADLKLIKRDGSDMSLPSKVPYHQVEAGDQLVALGPCGGGYDDPLHRGPGSGAGVGLYLTPDRQARRRHGHRYGGHGRQGETRPRFRR